MTHFKGPGNDRGDVDIRKGRWFLDMGVAVAL